MRSVEAVFYDPEDNVIILYQVDINTARQFSLGSEVTLGMGTIFMIGLIDDL